MGAVSANSTRRHTDAVFGTKHTVYGYARWFGGGGRALTEAVDVVFIDPLDLFEEHGVVQRP
jgi:hypothetical protein